LNKNLIANPGEQRMSEQDSKLSSQTFTKNALNAAIQIGILFLLASWCIDIIRPFVGIVAWAAIIAVAIYPLHLKLAGMLGGKEKISAVIIVLVGLSILIIPTWSLTGSSIETAQGLAQGLEEGTLKVPPPNESVESWPLVGEKIYKLWSAAASNLQNTLHQYTDQLQAFSAWLFKAIASTATGLLGFVASIIIAGVLLMSAGTSYRAFRKIGHRLGGDKGADFTDLAVATVRSVAKGVLGVALIQTFLAAIGLLVMGVPGAGIWASIVLLLAIMQLPPILILGPVAVWVFSTADPVPATIFLVYSVLVSFSDGLLKPLLLGRGVDVPMLVILLGAIGGMMTAGIIGLFIGAIVLALGYQLFKFWVDEGNEDSTEVVES
jgi:predicted PurR-regulated permease PerM